MVAVLRDEEAESRRGRETKWRSGGEGEKEWREGEKCERFRIYYREVPRMAFCGGVL